MTKAEKYGKRMIECLLFRPFDQSENFGCSQSEKFLETGIKKRQLKTAVSIN
jgi:hypothetical protein